MDFKTLGVSTPLLKALEKEEYHTATPIQEKAIPVALQGQDILGLAQTGTGKTAAFALPTLQLLAERPSKGQHKRIRALIVTPTRELAIQIQESFVSYGHYLSLKSTVIFGGVGQTGQVKALKAGIDILIATPGRLLDLISQGYIHLDAIEIFILDEADRMLDMGFIHDVKKIIKLLPEKKQTMLFSATMPKEINDIVNRLLVNPAKIEITPVSSTVDTVKQGVYFVDRNHKTDLLVDLLKENQWDSVLVFTRTKHGADKVVRELMKRNIKAQAIHGNKSQNARQGALKNFKSKETQVLVATDIASRGIDIEEMNYVVNYDLPEVPETYVHRIGRTGRAGHSGTAISLCNFQDKPLLRDIEKLIRKDIEVLENKKYPLIDLTVREKKPQRKKKVERQPENVESKHKGNVPQRKSKEMVQKNKKVKSKKYYPKKNNKKKREVPLSK